MPSLILYFLNSSQYNALSECHHLFYIFQLKAATMNDKLEKYEKKLRICKDYFFIPHRILRYYDE